MTKGDTRGKGGKGKGEAGGGRVREGGGMGRKRRREDDEYDAADNNYNSCSCKCETVRANVKQRKKGCLVHETCFSGFPSVVLRVIKLWSSTKHSFSTQIHPFATQGVPRQTHSVGPILHLVYTCDIHLACVREAYHHPA